MEDFVRRKGRLWAMFDIPDDMRTRQVLAVVFAVLSGASAVSTAVLPAVLHF
jgi:hypothetical protein